MKKTALIYLLISIILLASCKSTSHSNCDAYGFVDEEFDIQKTNSKEMSKYTSTIVIHN